MNMDSLDVFKNNVLPTKHYRIFITVSLFFYSSMYGNALSAESDTGKRNASIGAVANTQIKDEKDFLPGDDDKPVTVGDLRIILKTVLSIRHNENLLAGAMAASFQQQQRINGAAEEKFTARMDQLQASIDKLLEFHRTQEKVHQESIATALRQIEIEIMNGIEPSNIQVDMASKESVNSNKKTTDLSRQPGILDAPKDELKKIRTQLIHTIIVIDNMLEPQ